jgi:hypothetical protein
MLEEFNRVIQTHHNRLAPLVHTLDWAAAESARSNIRPTNNFLAVHFVVESPQRQDPCRRVRRDVANKVAGSGMRYRNPEYLHLQELVQERSVVLLGHYNRALEC